MSGIALRWVPGADCTGERPICSRTPPDTVVYAVGDIHGNPDLLEALQREIALDLPLRPARRKVVVYLGDYLSRGKQSREALERVRTWRPPCCETQIVPLKGNHEDFALRFLGREFGLGRYWLESGGGDTLASYGVKREPERPLDEQYLEELRLLFARALPPEHLLFLQRLPTCHREGGYLFVHAGVCPGVPLSEQTEHDHMWRKHDFLASQAYHGATVVHGHKIVAEPELHANRIAIDTGAFESGVLTCLLLDGARRSFLQASRG